MWGMHDGMGWWMLWGMLMMSLFWAVIVGLVVWGVARLTRDRSGRDETPLEIARRRYAGGEITREEFEQLRSDLS
jgi:putative membrane protein